MNPDIPGIKTILKNRSFKISLNLTAVFFALLIIFIALGLNVALLIILFPVVLGTILRAMPVIYLVGGIILMLLPLASRVTETPKGLAFIFMVTNYVPIIFYLAIFFHLLETYYKIKEEHLKGK